MTTTSSIPRRAFLFGIAGAASLTAAPKLILSSVPLLWGDGIHDDTAALRALFAGEPVKLGESGDTFRPLFGNDGDGMILKGGRYLISGPVPIRTPGALLSDLDVIPATDEGVFVFAANNLHLRNICFGSGMSRKEVMAMHRRGLALLNRQSEPTETLS